MDTTFPGYCGPGCIINEGVHRIPQISKTGDSPSMQSGVIPSIAMFWYKGLIHLQGIQGKNSPLSKYLKLLVTN